MSAQQPGELLVHEAVLDREALCQPIAVLLRGFGERRHRAGKELLVGREPGDHLLRRDTLVAFLGLRALQVLAEAALRVAVERLDALG